jgi:hypothetical protein
LYFNLLQEAGKRISVAIPHSVILCVRRFNFILQENLREECERKSFY